MPRGVLCLRLPQAETDGHQVVQREQPVLLRVVRQRLQLQAAAQRQCPRGSIDPPVRGARARRRCRRRVLFAVAASVRRRGVRHQSLGGSRGQATSAWPTIPDRTSRVRSGRNAACSSQHAACSARFSNVEDAPRRGLAAGRGDGAGRHRS